MIAAVVQMTSGVDLDTNLAQAAEGLAEAAERAAELVALPEMFPLLREEGDPGSHPHAEELPNGAIVDFLRTKAKTHAIWLAGGTLSERIPGDSRTYNTSLLVSPEGEICAVYRKIHLFDVELRETVLRESAAVRAGDEIVSADTPFGCVGLSVCYDVRFPELYRELAARGARILLVPSAFTVPTGRDHWEVLLRARAIENQAFVIAAAQYGEHNQSRRSYGHSMIIDPWGTVLATVPDGERVATARLDMGRLEDIRARLPALRHRRL